MPCCQKLERPGFGVAETGAVVGSVGSGAVAATNPAAAEIEVAGVVVGVAAGPIEPGGAA